MIGTLEKTKVRTNFTVAKLLGISAADNLLLAKKVEAGLSFESLERVSKFTGLPLESLRIAVRLTPRTLTRRRQEKKLSAEESDRLVSVSAVMAQAFELFEGDKEAALRWFTSPNRALGQSSPLEIASTEIGTREVENLIGRLEHGVFT